MAGNPAEKIITETTPKQDMNDKKNDVTMIQRLLKGYYSSDKKQSSSTPPNNNLDGYFGQKGSKNKPHGIGVMKFPDGSLYDG